MRGTFSSLQHGAVRAALQPGRDGRRQRQHRQRRHRGLRPALGDRRRPTGAPAAPALWSRWDGRRRRRRGQPASTGWSTRCSTPARAPSTRPRPSSTPASTSLGPGRDRHRRARRRRRRRGARRFQRPGTTWPTTPRQRRPAARCSPAADDAAPTRSPPRRSAVANEAGRPARPGSRARGRGQPDGRPARRPNKGAARGVRLRGTDAGNLLDQRDQLTLKLAELTGAAVTVNADSTVDVTPRRPAAGHRQHRRRPSPSPARRAPSPAGRRPGRPSARRHRGSPVTGGTPAGRSERCSTATCRATSPSSTRSCPAMVTAVNSQHALGVDATGRRRPGCSLRRRPPATLQRRDHRPAQARPPRIAAKGGLDNTNATALADLDMGADAYRSLVTGFGVTVASTRQARDEPVGADHPGRRLPRVSSPASASTRRWSTCWRPSAATRAPPGC